jgi:hypothetical protein
MVALAQQMLDLHKKLAAAAIPAGRRRINPPPETRNPPRRVRAGGNPLQRVWHISRRIDPAAV